MGLKFFSPSPKLTGGILEIQFNSKEQSAFFKLCQQTGYDQQKRLGSFKGGKLINCKLSDIEVASIIHSIENKGQTPIIHRFNNEISIKGEFKYYEYAGNDGKVKSGYILALTDKDGVKVAIGFSHGSAERLKRHLIFILDHFSSAVYAEDKQNTKEYVEKQEAAAKPKTRTTPKRELAPEYLPGEDEDLGVEVETVAKKQNVTVNDDFI